VYAGESKLKGYKVGTIESKEAIKGKNKLSKLAVNIGEEEPVTIVTNAKVSEGERVVVRLLFPQAWILVFYIVTCYRLRPLVPHSSLRAMMANLRFEDRDH
jgi:hypothetical protein